MADIPEKLATALADRYPIERELGSGGMAIVYLARDLKHDRSVALKVLRADYAATVGSERFLREIETAAKLAHPHILPLYDSGEADGFLYYVMPYAEGESLRDRLTREKRLPIEDAIQITREVADALSYAHERGVVHRDIKPENILLEAGEAVVADFGIARAISAAAGDTLTASGVIIGTPHYMSPEQATGDSSLDSRTDIYALGCVLYEMLAGEPPFTARTLPALIAQHVSESPRPIRDVRPEVPQWLDRATRTALAKSAADRFPTAQALSQSLAAHATPRLRLAPLWRRWARRVRRRPGLAVLGATAIGIAIAYYALDWRVTKQAIETDDTAAYPITNIGVLPFQDFSAEDNAYLAAGFTDFLTRHLAGITALKVPSYETIRRYGEEGISLDSVVARHRLGTLIEGNIIATDQQIQVSVHLTDALTREQIASIDPIIEPRSESPILLVSLSVEVAQLLRSELGSEIAQRTLAADTECGTCLELYFKAKEIYRQAESLVATGDTASATAALQQADSLLVEVEALDHNWAQPIIAQGWNAFFRAEQYTDTPGTYDPEFARIGIAHAERALEREPSNAEALELRGMLRSFLSEATKDEVEATALWEAAKRDLTDAVAGDPLLAKAWNRLSYIHWRDGRFVEAKAAAERALEEDIWLKDNESIIARLCQISFDLEEIDEARHWCVDEGRTRFPSRTGFVSFELLLYAAANGPEPDAERAWQLADTLVNLLSPHRREANRPRVMMDVAAVLARAGLADSARAVIRQARAIAPQASPSLDVREAMARLRLGETDEVLRLLGAYLEARPDRKAYIAKDWWWKPLHGHPGFQALVE